MIVPEDIGGYSVQPHCLHHLQSVLPVFSWYPGKVHLPAVDLYRLLVVYELTLFYFEGVFRLPVAIFKGQTC